jgi:hypothetical protein
MRATADIQTPALVNTRAETLVIQLGPGVVADHTKLPFEFGWLRASEVRAMFADYGNPFPPGRAAADQQLVEMGRVRSDAVAPRRVGCTPLTEPFSYAPSDDANFQYLWSPSAFAVDVRRFGDRWVRLDEVEPGAARRLTLPDLGSNTPWRVRANGACRLGER